jgi:O-antigen ligase
MMTDLSKNSDQSRQKQVPVFDYFLLAVCLAVLACRSTIPEGITSVLYTGKDIFATVTYNAVLSAILIVSALVWLAVNISRKKFRYRVTGIEFGLALFVIAGFSAISAASNKRAAIADFVFLTGALLTAVLLVQLLNSPTKIKLVLYVITALGVMQAYECTDQFFASNEITIEQYQNDPNGILNRIGIIPGTYRHMLFEHQLYSKDVRGYFTTGNSAGSFTLMALAAAVVLLLEKAKNIKPNHEKLTVLIIRAFITAFIIFGLLLTHSKGAIAAATIAVMMLFVHRLASKWLNRYKTFIVIAGVVFLGAIVCLIIWYGSRHGRLPGGNSMLVRWQYWTGAAEMYRDRPLTGVGGGNFADFYPHYKIPAAPETVKDPHNFLLSFLSQYGPLGLLGFIAAFIIPAGWMIFSRKTRINTESPSSAQKTKNFAPAFLLIIAPVLLIVRPMVLPSNLGGDISIVLWVISFLFIIPVVIFSVAFLLLSLKGDKTMPNTTSQAILFCGLISVLIHNCVDFAIFEPGVMMAFWAIAACLISIDSLNRQRAPKLIEVGYPLRIIGLILIAATVWACLSYAVIPAVRSTAKINRAQKELQTAANQAETGPVSASATMADAFNNAHNLLDAAARLDPYSPKPCSLDAKIYIQQFRQLVLNSSKEAEDAEDKWSDLLLQAEKQMLIAIDRNKADFKNYRTVTEVYRLLAATSDTSQEQLWLQKAYESAWKAVERYPGNGMLRIVLAQLAEQLGETAIAVEQYQTAVQIEDAYRHQFRQMYPGREMFSRMGEGIYQWVKKRVSELQGSIGQE